jgi:hypothetical protein
MSNSRFTLIILASVFTVACGESSDPATIIRPNFAAGGVGRPSVLVNPSSDDNGTAKTIQEGIDMVASGGNVLVLPGTYNEAVRINKGLTLETVGGEAGAVVIAPPGAALVAVEIATAEPVIIRGLTVHARPFGIRGVVGVAENLTVERATVLAIDPPLAFSALIDIGNDAPTSTRGRLVVRESFLDGSVDSARSVSPPLPILFGIRVTGDVDTRLEGNVIRRTGGAGCIAVEMRSDFGGTMNVDIVDNDLDECYGRRAGAITVGPPLQPAPPFPPVTATGTVNIVGNTIRNSTGSCLRTSAISYEFYAGNIERNRIDGVVQACAAATDRARPAGIWIGSLRGLPAATPSVRFNDIGGNAQAGLRMAGNITTTLDASCNWWGSASGPSGAGAGSGDAVVVEAGAATPLFLPFATGLIAGTHATGC